MPLRRVPSLLPCPRIRISPSAEVTSVPMLVRTTPSLLLVPAPPVPSMVIVAASAPVPVEETTAPVSWKMP